MAQNIASSNNIDGVRLEEQPTISAGSLGSYTQLQMYDNNIAWSFSAVSWVYGTGTLIRSTDPDAFEDSYPVGTEWRNTTDNRNWVCMDNTASNAVWQLTGGFLRTQTELTADESISNNTQTDVPWDAVASGTSSWWSASPNPERVIPARAGAYSVFLSARWAFDNTGLRLVQVTRNGTGLVGVRKTAAGNSEETITVPYVEMNGTTDYFTMRVLQSSGGNLNLTTSSYMEVTYLGVQ